jgi:hypothetical protein
MNTRNLLVSNLVLLSIFLITTSGGLCNNHSDILKYSVREITLKQDKDEMRIFPKPIGLHKKDNYLFIGDSKECCIKVFTLSGEYLRTIGRKGEGPAEFRLLSDFDLYKDHIFVLEGNQVKVLDLNGVPIKCFKVSGNSFRIAVLDEGHIVISNFPNMDPKNEPLVYCYDTNGKLIWRYLSSKYSSHSVINTMQNQLLLVKGKKNEFFALRKMNERAIHRLSINGKELNKITVPSGISFKEIDFNIRGNRIHFSDFCQDVYWEKDKLFVLLKEYCEEKNNKDTIPGKEIVVLNMEGMIEYFIKLPDSFRKILGVQDNVIFGIDYDNSELRKFELETDESF